VTPPFCLCCQGYAHPGVSAPAAASGGGGGDVSGAVVGSLVVLAPDYASYSDASGGPLSLGQVGVVVQTSSTRLQVKVNPSGDRVWWYVHDSLSRTLMVYLGTPCSLAVPDMLQTHVLQLMFSHSCFLMQV
jgi:hypothetical protein